MPYVPPANRIALDAIVEGLVKRLREIKCKPGDCNYVVTRVVLESLKPETGWSYHSLSDAVRVLKDAATEIERRLLGPYEDTAIIKNGDMPCFQEKFTKHPVASEQIMENGRYRTRCLPSELDREDRKNVAEVLQKGLEERHLKRLAEAEKVEGIADRVPEFNYVPEEKREAFERMCKERTERLKNLNDGLQRIIDGDTPPPVAEAACDEPCGADCEGCGGNCHETE